MKHWNAEYITHLSTNSFTKIVLDYLANDEKLKKLFAYQPDAENIIRAIAQKQKNPIDRNILVNGLNDQYKDVNICEAVTSNIQLLQNENTFTICTAHQPNIFTGPLYYIYKILHTIALCRYLKIIYPTYHFVPVYYMGAEDADIAEIGTFHFNKNTFQWHPAEAGAVGRIPTTSMHSVLQEVLQYINADAPNGKKLFNLFTNAYGKNLSLSVATLYMVNELFGQYGLLIFQPDDKIFKSVFASIMRNELLQQQSNSKVDETNNYIQQYYTPQAHSRELNLFYTLAHSKERIEKIGDVYQIVNAKLQFTQEQILKELEDYPERFSPNVILRGVYQESVLPNIAFIGGGAELAYWLQLKNVFALHNTPYPMLILRQSIALVASKAADLQKQLGLGNTDVFLPIDTLKKNWIQNQLQIHAFEKQWILHDALFDSYKTYTDLLPKQFLKSIAAHEAKSKKVQIRMQKKLIAAFKKKEELAMQQIDLLRENYFPNNTLQERYENFIPYYLQFGNDLFENILQHITPFGNQFLLLQMPNS